MEKNSEAKKFQKISIGITVFSVLIAAYLLYVFPCATTSLINGLDGDGPVRPLPALCAAVYTVGLSTFFLVSLIVTIPLSVITGVMSFIYGNRSWRFGLLVILNFLITLSFVYMFLAGG